MLVQRFSMLAVATTLVIAAPIGVSAANRSVADQQVADRDATDLTRALTGMVAGRPVSCIDQHRVGGTQRIGDTILYELSNREIYRAHTDGGCFGLRHGDAIVSRSFSDRLCAGDILRTVDLQTRSTTGSCTIDEFVPYRR